MNNSQEPPERTLLVTNRFRVVQVDRRLADGSVKRREVIRHPGSVAILPLVDRDHVCLIRNFRVAIGRPLIELPAGTLEPGEDPRATAERELLEETGYRAGHLQRLHAFHLSPGVLDERMQLFLAEDLVPGEAAREPGEEIENVVTPWEEALRMVESGEIEDVKTIVGLLYGDRLRAR